MFDFYMYICDLNNMYIIHVCNTHMFMYMHIYIYTYMSISADLFQSESVLAHIVINQYFAILQTPISYCCNTLQSPILQIAIHLYCRVQLTDCSILKGVGQIRQRLPQAATARHSPPQAGQPSGPR